MGTCTSPAGTRCALLAAICAVLSCVPVSALPPGGVPTPFNLPLALQADMAGRPYLYAALKPGGVRVLDAAGPAVKPGALVDRAALGGLDATNLDQVGDRLYVALGDHFAAGGDHAGLAVLDVGDPARPSVVGLWRSTERLHGAADIAVSGQVAWIAAMDRGVIAVDVSDPGRPRELSRFRPDPGYPRANPGPLQQPAARGLAVDGSLLYLAYDAGGLRVLDISTPTAPREVGRYVNPRMGAKPSAYNNVLVRAGLAYVAADYCGLEVIDVRNPAAMQPVGWWNPWGCDAASNTWFNSQGHSNQLAWAGPSLIALSAGDAEVAFVDVTDAANPRAVGTGGGIGDGLGTWSVAVGGGRAWLGYIATPLPFRGNWSGVRAVPLP